MKYRNPSSGEKRKKKGGDRSRKKEEGEPSGCQLQRNKE